MNAPARRHGAAGLRDDETTRGDDEMNTDTTTRLTSRWKTICIVGYDSTLRVERTEGDPRKARGGVCLCQARLSGKNGYRGRYVNTTGWPHREIGYAFDIDAERLRQWEELAAGQRQSR